MQEGTVGARKSGGPRLPFRCARLRSFWWAAFVGACAAQGTPEPVAAPPSPAATTQEPKPPEGEVPRVPAPRKSRSASPHSVALVIGIEKYRRDLPNASGAVSDARLFADYAEQSFGIPRANIRLLVNEEATRSSIDAELNEWLPKNASLQGDVLVFFAGHGAPEPTTGTRFLVPWDADPRYITTQGISIGPMQAVLGKLKARRVYAFLDACFSGAGGRSVLAPGTRPMVLGAVAPAPPPKKNEAPKLFSLSAAGANEITGIAPSGNGLFSYYLLKGLSGEADADRDAAVDWGELADYTAQQVANEARRQNRDQRPVATPADAAARKQVLASLDLSVAPVAALGEPPPSSALPAKKDQPTCPEGQRRQEDRCVALAQEKPRETPLLAEASLLYGRGSNGALNAFSLGAGARVGALLAPRVYAGVAFAYHTGQEVTGYVASFSPGGGNEAERYHMRRTLVGAELGYQYPLGPALPRGTLGAGYGLLSLDCLSKAASHDSCNGPTYSAKSAFYLAPGLVVRARVRGWLTAHLEGRYVVFLDGSFEQSAGVGGMGIGGEF